MLLELLPLTRKKLIVKLIPPYILQSYASVGLESIYAEVYINYYQGVCFTQGDHPARLSILAMKKTVQWRKTDWKIFERGRF